ncbi:MAG TPA: LytTR family DNA-binding domain-containing protein [Verrucomicrobiae bacterium]|jgi:two-component system LytT family response regulator|nr:LytTR family DNA-binding domain-containing protein [Verrucomicrobiae bacterium]
MKALLVDDERLARSGLRRLLNSHDDVTVVGEAANADEALAQIRRLDPDVVFLDVEMPGRSGLELLEDLEEVPAVIFTTAFQEYAVRAFEVSALDYLLKPIAADRLDEALDKARKIVGPKGAGPGRKQRVFLREGERCWIVAVEEIRVLESEGNYTRVYFAGNRPLIYKSLNALEATLDPTTFFRASRSHIVNLRDIQSLEPQAEGGLVASLTGGLKIGISRRQARKLREVMSL